MYHLSKGEQNMCGPDYVGPKGVEAGNPDSIKEDAIRNCLPNNPSLSDPILDQIGKDIYEETTNLNLSNKEWAKKAILRILDNHPIASTFMQHVRLGITNKVYVVLKEQQNNPTEDLSNHKTEYTVSPIPDVSSYAKDVFMQYLKDEMNAIIASKAFYNVTEGISIYEDELFVSETITFLSEFICTANMGLKDRLKLAGDLHEAFLKYKISQQTTNLRAISYKEALANEAFALLKEMNECVKKRNRDFLINGAAYEKQLTKDLEARLKEITANIETI